MERFFVYESGLRFCICKNVFEEYLILVLILAEACVERRSTECVCDDVVDFAFVSSITW